MIPKETLDGAPPPEESRSVCFGPAPMADFLEPKASEGP